MSWCNITPAWMLDPNNKENKMTDEAFMEIRETMKQTGYVNAEGVFVPTDAPIYIQTDEDAVEG